jgi:hypothetical protein
MRSAVQQAQNAYAQSNNTANTLASEGQGINSTLTPFLTAEMQHPQGIGQSGLAAENAAALGGAGGAAAGLTGVANQRAAASHNAGGYQAALDDVARQRMKAAAGTSEGITGENEMLKQRQQQEGASGLAGLYGTDTTGMLSAQGNEARDIGAEAEANNTGWFQNTTDMIRAINSAAKSGAAIGDG